MIDRDMDEMAGDMLTDSVMLQEWSEGKSQASAHMLATIAEHLRQYAGELQSKAAFFRQIFGEK